MHDREGWYPNRREMNPRQRKLIVLVLILAAFTILPLGSMVDNLKEGYKTYRPPMPKEEQVKAVKICEEIANRAKVDPDYTALKFVLDRNKLLKIIYNDLATKEQYSIPEQLVNHCRSVISGLHDISQSQYKKKYHGDQVNADWFWRSEEMEASRNNNPYPDGLVGTDGFKRGLCAIGRWYLEFIPFALLILMINVFFDVRYKLKDELILRPVRIVLSAIFWPIGLGFYPDGDPAATVRYFRLRGAYLATKHDRWRYELSSDEEEMLRRKASQRIDDFDKLVSEIASVPIEQVRKQSRVLAFATLFFSILLTPFVSAKAVSRSKQDTEKEVATAIFLKATPGILIHLPSVTKVKSFDCSGITTGPIMTLVFCPAILPMIPSLDILPGKWWPSDCLNRPPPNPTFHIDHIPD